MKKIDIKNKKISVLGTGLSGKALARILTSGGANVLLSDTRTEEQLMEAMNELAEIPLEWETGGHTKNVYENRDLIVISPGVSIYHPILQEAGNAGVPIISEVEMAFLLTGSPFIAITGTNGKSTTTTLVHKTLLADGQKSYLAGNIGVPLVGEVSHIPDDAWITAEISSFQLEAVEHFRPKIAALLNVKTDHIDRHHTFHEYKMAKANLFKKQSENDFAVLNADDPEVMSIAELIPSKILLFSRKRKVDQGAYVENGIIKTRFGDMESNLLPAEEVPLKGNHNLENVLALTCVCTAAGVRKESIIKALNKFKPLHYRMAYVDEIDGKKFYNDSKGTNPAAVGAALESFKEPVVIIAGGTDKGLDFAPLAYKIKNLSVHAVLIGESRRKIAAALNAAGFREYTVIDDMTLEGFKTAIKTACAKCPGGGVVLLSPSCASFDMFKRAEHRGEMFDKYVRELKKENEKEV